VDPLLFLRGVLIGVAVAAPVGPIGLLCLRRALEGGLLAGFLVGLGAALADALFGAVAAFGVSAALAFVADEAGLLRGLGGAATLGIGLALWRAKPPTPLPERPGLGRHAAGFATGLALTLTNPLTMLGFVAIFAGFGLAAAPGGLLAPAVLTGGVFCGSALWFLGLALAATRLRGRVGPGLMRRINGATAAALIGFGLFALGSAAIGAAQAQTPARPAAPPAPAPAQGPAPRDLPRATIQEGPWRGGAQADKAGRFSHCSVAVPVEGTARAVLSLNAAGALRLGLVLPGPALEAGAVYDLPLRIDRGKPAALAATAVDDRTLSLPLDPARSWTARLKAGGTLTLGAGEESIAVPLAGSGRALRALEACAASRGATARPGSGADRSFDAAIVRALLEAAEIAAAPLPAGEVPTVGRPLDHAWGGAGLFGGVHQQGRPAGESPVAFLQRYLLETTRRCPSGATTQIAAPKTVADLALLRADIACPGAAGAVHAAVLVAADDATYSVFFHESADRALAAGATERLMRVLEKFGG